MFDNRGYFDKKQKRVFPAAVRTVNNQCGQRFTAEQIKRLFTNHPELRLDKDPAAQQLAHMILSDAADDDVHEMLAWIVNEKYREFSNSGWDRFWANYQIPVTHPDDFIPVAAMVNGSDTGINVSQGPRNIIVSGLTGSGKTCLLMNMIANKDGKLIRQCRVIIFARKQEFRHLVSIKNIADLILTLYLDDIKISFLEPPCGVDDLIWLYECSSFTAQNYGLYSAQRLMTDCGVELFKHHPPGLYPTLKQLIDRLERYRPRDYFREGQLKTSIVTCLTDLWHATGKMWEFASSNFMEVLTTTPGLAVIEMPATDPRHVGLIATYMMKWLYLRRVYGK
jgi:hypothetical protein